MDMHGSLSPGGNNHTTRHNAGFGQDDGRITMIKIDHGQLPTTAATRGAPLTSMIAAKSGTLH